MFLRCLGYMQNVKDTICKIRNNPIHTPNGDELIGEFIKKGPMLIANIVDNKPAYLYMQVTSNAKIEPISLICTTAQNSTFALFCIAFILM